MHREREEERPAPPEDEPDDAARVLMEFDSFEPPSSVDADPLAVEARPTPLPRVDAALLGLSVQVLTHAKQVGRRSSIAPPPAPPAARSEELSHADELASEPAYGAFDTDDSSVSLMEMIDGVPRPLGSAPLPSQRVPAYREPAPAVRHRLLTWLGIAAGIVQCTILALAFPASTAPKPAGIVIHSAGAVLAPAVDAPLAPLAPAVDAPLAPAPAVSIEPAQLEPLSPATVDHARAASPKLERATHRRSKRHRFDVSTRSPRSKKQRRLRAMRRSISTRGSQA